MSAVPISAVEISAAVFAEAKAAGWKKSDLLWEAEFARAAELFVIGESESANLLWARALRRARRGFDSDDPRLAASLANCAAALRAKGRKKQSEKMFAEAKTTLARCGEWIARARPEQTARSSVHHFRMEVKNRAVYRENFRNRLRAFAEEAAVAVCRLEKTENAPLAVSLARWQKEKPPICGDSRKLLAAVLLLAHAP